MYRDTLPVDNRASIETQPFFAIMYRDTLRRKIYSI